jgi:hypothetical protein
MFNGKLHGKQVKYVNGIKKIKEFFYGMTRQEYHKFLLAKDVLPFYKDLNELIISYI